MLSRYQRAVGQAAAVAAETVAECVIITVCEIFLHKCYVMAYVVLCAPRFVYSFLQTFVLHRLHGEHMIIFLQRYALALLEYEP